MLDGAVPPPAPPATQSGEGSRNVTPPDSQSRSSVWRTIVLALVSVGLGVGIIAGAGPARVGKVFADTGWLGILHLLSLYTLVQFLRAARFTVCIATPRPPFARMLAVVCMHQFLNHVLPARLGELSFPLLASRYAAVPTSAATRLLVVIRIYELIVLGVFFLGAASSMLIRGSSNFLIGSIVGCAAMLLLLLLLLFRGMPTLSHLARIALGWVPIGRWQRSALRSRTQAYLERLHSEFLRPRPPREFLSVVLFSVLIWIVLFWINYQALRYAGIDVTFLDTIVGSTFANASHVLPINTFGSIGSLEAGWTFGFVLLGVPAKAALASGFALHVIGIAFLSVSASGAWIVLQRAAPRPLRP